MIMSIKKDAILPYARQLSSIDFSCLPEELIPLREYQIFGRSRTPLKFSVDTSYICIEDRSNSRLILQASLDANYISWAISTKLNGKYHPDLYASQFYEVAYEYLISGSNGAITGIVGWWIDGDNFSKYHHNISLGMSKSEAALDTWSGRKAAERGFGKVEIVSEYRDIHLNFLRT